MPCTVCLEDFKESFESVHKAPHALKCGHIFHGECIQTWFKACLSAAGSSLACPQCKTSCKDTTESFRLYPTEVYDLDAHLQRRAAVTTSGNLPSSSQGVSGDHFVQRTRRTLTGAQADTAITVKEDADDATDKGKLSLESDEVLLGSLLDFTRSLQAYVIAVHGLRLQTVRKAGKKVFQFVDQLVSDEDQKAEIQTCIESLQVAMEQFEGAKNKMLERTFKRDEEERSYQKKKVNLQKKMTALESDKQQLKHERARDLDTRKQLDELEAKLMKEQKLLDQAKQKLQIEKEASWKDVREANLRASHAKLEANREVAQMRDEKETAVSQMLEEVKEYKQRTKQAEDERAAIKRKNYDMAMDMRRNFDKLDKLKGERTKMQDQLEDARREVQKLKVDLAQHQREAQHQVSASGSAKASSRALCATGKQPWNARHAAISDAVGGEDSSVGASVLVDRTSSSSSGGSGGNYLGKAKAIDVRSSSPLHLSSPRHRAFKLHQGMYDVANTSVASSSASRQPGDDSLEIVNEPRIDFDTDDDGEYMMPGGIGIGQPASRIAAGHTAVTATHGSAKPLKAKQVSAPGAFKRADPESIELAVAPSTPRKRKHASASSPHKSPVKSPEDRQWQSPYVLAVSSRKRHAGIPALQHARSELAFADIDDEEEELGMPTILSAIAKEKKKTLPVTTGASDISNPASKGSNVTATGRRPIEVESTPKTADELRKEKSRVADMHLRRLMQSTLSGTVAIGARRRA
ncbi:hypothetical protein K437DRAFT_147219 [Tilletiaria anomala UBC 951]|uniref:RING-type domain-containing protein n=1 Tax=Tilletiaria anomala (strain ATCC 24038 / CBS 436.72 / UBC 951) TaxID=1037660 RepID=A0A066VYP1_TILAU|nr:uncharacterized protein K437DRAFT_147219 [Tilletiaria anomala UBC 951]KDN43670.1 hypothetical protein K437DRAFT_147219 [Tilletiaria anomala UBC 951]